MDSKSRNLIMALEFLLLATAGIVILIDFKLKRDLLLMFVEIKTEIESGQRNVAKASNNSSDTSGVHTGDLVGNASAMEAASVPHENGSAPKPRTGTARAVAKRSTGNGNTGIPQLDKPVGS